MKLGILGVKGRIGSALSVLAAGHGHSIVGYDLGDSRSALWEAFDADATVNFTQNLNYMFGPMRAYFDASERVEKTADLARFHANETPGQLFVPNCGIAPGALNILAGKLLREAVGRIHECMIYCGALPESRWKGYSVTWSPEGLANLYSEMVVERGMRGTDITVAPLAVRGTKWVMGSEFEYFNTSGGLGTLLESFPDTGPMGYRTLRYPGHTDKIKRMKAEGGDLAQKLIERWPDDGMLDRVVASVNVLDGEGDHRIEFEVKPAPGLSAIQIATATGVLAAIEATKGMTGYIKQEDIPFDAWLQATDGVYA